MQQHYLIMPSRGFTTLLTLMYNQAQSMKDEAGECSPEMDGDSIHVKSSVESGTELTEAAGAKRAALRPNGPRSAPGKRVRIHVLKSKLSCQTKFAILYSALVVVGLYSKSVDSGLLKIDV